MQRRVERRRRERRGPATRLPSAVAGIGLTARAARKITNMPAIVIATNRAARVAQQCAAPDAIPHDNRDAGAGEKNNQPELEVRPLAQEDPAEQRRKDRRGGIDHKRVRDARVRDGDDEQNAVGPEQERHAEPGPAHGEEYADRRPPMDDPDAEHENEAQRQVAPKGRRPDVEVRKAQQERVRSQHDDPNPGNQESACVRRQTGPTENHSRYHRAGADCHPERY